MAQTVWDFFRIDFINGRLRRVRAMDMSDDGMNGLLRAQRRPLRKPIRCNATFDLIPMKESRYEPAGPIEARPPFAGASG